MDDYYQLLEIAKNASAEEIKKAYRKQAMKWHPDRNQGNKEAEEKFKKVSHAYEVLSDPQKRAVYDQHGPAAFEGPNAGPGASAAGGFRDPMDIFQQFFSGMQGGGGSIFESFFGGRGGDGGASTGPQEGEDIGVELRISLEEAAAGVERKIPYQRYANCPECHGTGAEKNTSRKKCTTCKGKGQVVRSSGFFSIRQPCPQCGGAGEIIENPCKRCKGNGRVPEEHTVSVKIPPGVDTGSRLRSVGNGHAGANGGPNGDLYVSIRVLEHDLFDRQDDDLFCTVPIKFSIAALGGTVEVATLNGRAALKIPPGTQSGTTFRLREKGVPHIRGGGSGDLLVRIEIDVPKKLTEEQRAKLEDFARASGDSTNPVSESWAEKFRRFFKN
ncbi:MAG: molecular chaperone DnaJ [Puniceicoccales bacterium]|jgi:molecular chaperone DnaJ|nr:molecular chaperone DnaJ [Puniceicoccales bacterium]